MLSLQTQQIEQYQTGDAKAERNNWRDEMKVKDKDFKGGEGQSIRDIQTPQQMHQ